MDRRLAAGDPEVWSHAVEAANPASMLVAIRCRMGADLHQRVSPEDLWQETLLKAWQARENFVWEGTPSFRRWLLAIAEHAIADHRDHARAKKRDVARTTRFADAHQDSTSREPGLALEPWGSATPSRLAVAREQAQAMAKALDSLPDEVREVVRMRLFDELPIAEIAERLALGESAVRHRFRRGAEEYRKRLHALLRSSSTGAQGAPAPH